MESRYGILMDFIAWCENNDYTEWMGYYGKAEKIVGMYLEQKYGDYLEQKYFENE